ncbi:MAG: FtsQ-type POTRA domain-containing protein [Terriglobales bacterium]
MARKPSSTAIQEELYPLPGVSQREAPEREPFDDARLVDLEAEQESPFLRGQKRVSVRRGSLPQKTANRLMWVGVALVAFAIFGAAGLGLYRYGKHSWRFRIDSSDQIEVAGAQHVAHAQIMEVMGGDIGRNIFFVPLAQRKQQLEQIPWVESASVMRFVPNRLRIEIHERTPVAFARIGSHIFLIDAGGTLMELAPGGKHRYSFAVIAGMNAGEPLSTRAARMKNYNELVRELDSGGAHYSQELSEVDLSDPEDVKVLAADANGEVLVHLGSGNYLQRYKTYVTHVQQWRQQFEKLESVDLRYDGQIIVNPDLDGMARQPVLTPAAAEAAMAAGVKTAAIVNYEKYVTHPVAAAPAKKDAKPKAKAATKAAVHRAPATPAPATPAPAKPAPAKPAPVKQAPVKQAALKTKVNEAPVATAKNTAVSHPAAPSPAASTTPVAVTTSQKKPSAGIPKETPQN